LEEVSLAGAKNGMKTVASAKNRRSVANAERIDLCGVSDHEILR